MLPAHRSRVVPFLLLLAGCGGGSAPDEAFRVGTLQITNGPATFGGQANTHAIVRYDYVSSGVVRNGSSGPISIMPGASVPLTLPSGGYSLTVIYDDGGSERLQAPPDQVDVYADEVRSVLFMR